MEFEVEEGEKAAGQGDGEDGPTAPVGGYLGRVEVEAEAVGEG